MAGESNTGRGVSGLNVRPVHRVKGRPALERRLRGLLIALHRFARARARTPDDLYWTARAIDGLTAILAEPKEHTPDRD